MEFYRVWLLPLLLVVQSVNAIGCAHRSINGTSYDNLSSQDQRPAVYLKNGLMITGTVLTITDQYIIMSVEEVPEVIRRSQEVPVRIGPMPVILYKRNGEKISGRIISIREDEVEVESPGMLDVLPGSEKMTIRKEEIERVFLMGKPGETRITIQQSDVQSVHGLVGHKDKNQVPVVVFILLGGLLGIGLLSLALGGL